eukprot:356379-Chlamydomonas_euryale.AAC.4
MLLPSDTSTAIVYRFWPPAAREDFDSVPGQIPCPAPKLPDRMSSPTLPFHLSYYHHILSKAPLLPIGRAFLFASVRALSCHSLLSLTAQATRQGGCHNFTATTTIGEPNAHTSLRLHMCTRHEHARLHSHKVSEVTQLCEMEHGPVRAGIATRRGVFVVSEQAPMCEREHSYGISLLNLSPHRCSEHRRVWAAFTVEQRSQLRERDSTRGRGHTTAWCGVKVWAACAD